MVVHLSQKDLKLLATALTAFAKGARQPTIASEANELQSRLVLTLRNKARFAVFRHTDHTWMVGERIDNYRRWVLRDNGCRRRYWRSEKAAQRWADAMVEEMTP